MLTPSPDIYHDIPFKVYRQWEAINFSSLKSMAVSPKQYKYDLEHPQDKQCFKIGRAMHTFALEPHLVAESYVRAPLFKTKKGDVAKNQGNTTEYKEFAEKVHSEGKEILSEDEYHQVEMMRDTALEIDTNVLGYLEDGFSEMCCVWRDPVTGMLCKCRVDHLRGLAILDLKSTRDLSLKGFKRAIKDNFYHVQGSWYGWGVEQASRQSENPKQEVIIPEVFNIYGIENHPPYDGDVFSPNIDSMIKGDDLYRAWLDELKVCMDTDYWPGRFRTGIKIINVTGEYNFLGGNHE